MSPIGSLFVVWVVLSVLAIGFLYIGSANGSRDVLQRVEDWKKFD